MRGFRWPAALLVPSLMVGAAVYDDQQRSAPDVTSADPGYGLSVIGPAGQSTTWFCAAASVGDADVLTITNPTSSARSAQVTLMPAVLESGDDGPAPVELRLDIGAREQTTLRPTDEIDAAVVSAVVEVDGGGVIVEHVNTLVEQGSTDRRPCATEAGAVAYLPAGSTSDDAHTQLVLFNPFPDDAVLDITFDSDIGRRNPRAYEGLVVPGRSGRVLDLADEVPQRQWLSTFVEARSGRIIVDRVLRFDGETRSGLSVATGIAAPQTVAYLPVGRLGPDDITNIIVQNPSEDVAAEVDITIIVSSDRVVEPLERRIFARSSAVIDLSSEAFAGTLAGVEEFSILVESANGVPIAVERLEASAGTDRSGTSTTIGASLASTVWLTDVSIADPSRSAIVMLNPSFSTLVQVRVFRAGDDEPAAELELRRGGRAVLRLDEITDATGVFEIVATSPIVVERDLVGVNSRSTALGLPAVEAQP